MPDPQADSRQESDEKAKDDTGVLVQLMEMTKTFLPCAWTAT